MDSQLDSRYSRQQAARCLQVAEATLSDMLRGVLLAEAEAWNRLADDQEWLEQRAADRAQHDALSESSADAEAHAFARVA